MVERERGDGGNDWRLEGWREGLKENGGVVGKVKGERNGTGKV